jgi:hypothetical protein
MDNNQHDVFILSAVRTAIGKYGGGLASVPPCDLAATVVREAVSRAAIEPTDVGHAVFGNVIHTEVRDMYLSRVPRSTGAFPLRRRRSPSTGYAEAACRRSSPPRRRSSSATARSPWPAVRNR